MSQLTEEIKSKLDLYIDDMDKVLDAGTDIRTELIQDMLRLKEDMLKPDCNIDPEFHMARMSTFNTLQQMLDSRDKAKIKKVEIQLKKKSDETNAALGKIAAEALKNFTNLGAKEMMDRTAGTIVVPDDKEITAQLEQVFDNHGIKITNTELRDDYMDLSDSEEK